MSLGSLVHSVDGRLWFSICIFFFFFICTGGFRTAKSVAFKIVSLWCHVEFYRYYFHHIQGSFCWPCCPACGCEARACAKCTGSAFCSLLGVALVIVRYVVYLLGLSLVVFDLLLVVLTLINSLTNCFSRV